jgi:hypothetical protein
MIFMIYLLYHIHKPYRNHPTWPSYGGPPMRPHLLFKNAEVAFPNVHLSRALAAQTLGPPGPLGNHGVASLRRHTAPVAQ